MWTCFGVNLFLPGRPTTDSEGLAAYLRALGAEAAALGTTLGEPEWDDDDYPRKLDLLLAEPPAVVSFTFGVPASDVVRALQGAGSLVVVTVSTPEEAGVALRVGPDALCLQGSEAGAHRGSLANDFRPDADRPIRALLAAVWGRTLVPLIAAGGVGGPADVRDLLTRGATLVQAGTAFLRCPESGAHPLAKAALADPSFGSHRGDPRLQRAPGPGPRQRHGARPRRCTGGVPGDQQRDPTPACGRRGGRRPSAHEPLCGRWAPPGRGERRGRSGGASGVGGARVSRRQPKEKFEFTPPDIEHACAALARLRHEGDGWMNLLPGVPEGSVRAEEPAGLFAVFGNRASPVTMATLIPPKADRRESEGVSVGLMHPTGGKAVARLREAGVELPTGWVVRQDHVRRGLVLRTAATASEEEIVTWSVDAGDVLCLVETTGRWQAVLYLP